MPRRTVTVNKAIESKLREIQAGLIRATHKDCSFTRVVNLVLLGGLVGSYNFDKKVWKTLNEFEGEINDLNEDVACNFTKNIDKSE